MEYGNIENPKVAHFTFFGQQGVAITGKEAELLVPDVTAEMTDIPPQIMALVGKKYILIADLAEGSLDADELCFQVSSIEEINDGQSEKASSQATVVPTTDSTASANIIDPISSSSAPMDLEQTPPETPLSKVKFYCLSK